LRSKNELDWTPSKNLSNSLTNIAAWYSGQL